MSLTLGLVVAAGGVVVGRWIAKNLAPRASAEAQREPAAPAHPSEPPIHLPCHLGDVVTRVAERDEAWLAAALYFAEDQPVAALFVAPEAGADRAIFARADEEAILWLTAIGEKETASRGEPPHSLEHEGLRFERTRRLPVRVVRRGAGAPPVGDRAVVAEYAAATGQRILLVAGNERTLAWLGGVLEKGEFDVLPGGRATLE